MIITKIVLALMDYNIINKLDKKLWSTSTIFNVAICLYEDCTQ
jgi:hypothetical protein